MRVTARNCAIRHGYSSGSVTPMKEGIMDMKQLALLLLAGIALTLYIMRRRSRQGKRTPKF